MVLQPIGNQVKGLPEGWIWIYGPGHGWKGRHAVNVYNDELSLPVRQVQAIQKGADFKTTLDTTIARRDKPVGTHFDDTWQKRKWNSVDYQFSTGAYRFVLSLDDKTRTYITATGYPHERYSDTEEQEIVTRTLAGYRQASFYKVNSRFYQDVFVPAYEIFEAIEYFTVHYEV